jgi:ribosome-binding ATPase YchF (GTP1/OBG family)
MDPLPIASEIRGIIGGVTAVRQHAHQFHDQLNNSLKEVRRFGDEIRHFESIWMMVRVFETENIPYEPRRLIGWCREETTSTLNKMRKKLKSFEKRHEREKIRWIYRNGPLALFRGRESERKASVKRWKTFLGTSTMRLNRERLQLARQRLMVIVYVIKLVIYWT